MKNKIIALLFVLFIGACITPSKATSQGVSVSFQVFYDDLSPYGSWVESPDYGYVWIPEVSSGFTPYATNGYWAYTDEGWTWISYYAWGWAPFHYGRWYTDAMYGPIWVPDYQWGPGWVNWRQSDGFYGWSPMGPGNNYDSPYNQWTFVGANNFGSTTINNYYVDNSTNITVYNNSTVINNVRVNNTTNTSYNMGPNRAEVEKRSNRSITPIKMTNSSKPGQSVNKNQMLIYRPQVTKAANDKQKPVPYVVDNMTNVKPAAQRVNATPTKGNTQQTKTQPTKIQKVQKQNNQQPTKTQPTQQQNKQQPTKTQPTQQQNKQQPTKTQPTQQQNKQQPTKTQPTQQQNKQQPTKTQPTKQQNKQQPNRTQPTQQQPTQQPTQT